MSMVWEKMLEWDVVPLVTAIVLGGLIGLERQIHRKPAGLRTNMTICMAATVFTLLAAGFVEVDPQSRVIQGVITGVGFLGAGALLHTQGNVYGLTTAASIWLVTGVGIACGLGQYHIAVVATVLTLMVLWGISPLDKKIKRSYCE